MPGDRWQRFANLRAYFGFMWGHPGKKLMFMGGELAQEREWNHDRDLDWLSLEDPFHAGVQRAVRDLNKLYRSEPALHRRDCEGEDSNGLSVTIVPIPYLPFYAKQKTNASTYREQHDACPRHGYRIGVPLAGGWHEFFNSDSGFYGGSNVGNAGRVETTKNAAHGQAQSLELILPPLATIYLRHEG